MPRPVQDGPLRVGGRTVQVSSVAKPSFPEIGLTKGDLLADYRGRTPIDWDELGRVDGKDGFVATLDLSARERKVVLAGGVLNQLKEAPDAS
jgi:hypothetical protein